MFLASSCVLLSNFIAASSEIILFYQVAIIACLITRLLLTKPLSIVELFPIAIGNNCFHTAHAKPYALLWTVDH